MSSRLSPKGALTMALKDLNLIGAIVERVLPMSKRANVSVGRDEWEKIISDCHCKGMTLDLEALYTAPDKEFAHDVFGIRAHMDKRTGEVHDFLPYCTKGFK